MGRHIAVAVVAGMAGIVVGGKVAGLEGLGSHRIAVAAAGVADALVAGCRIRLPRGCCSGSCGLAARPAGMGFVIDRSLGWTLRRSFCVGEYLQVS